MKRLILKSDRMLKQEDFDKMKSIICRDIKELGFAIIPPNFEVYEFDDSTFFLQEDPSPEVESKNIHDKTYIHIPVEDFIDILKTSTTLKELKKSLLLFPQK